MLPEFYKSRSSILNQPKLIRLVSVLITNIIQSVDHQPQFFFQLGPGILAPIPIWITTTGWFAFC